MADEQPQAPSQQQLDSAKAAADAELARWEGDFPEESLEVKYKRDAEDDKKEEENQDDVETDKETAEAAKDSAEDKEIAQLPEVESVLTAEDPGEYVPADHSFEVTLADGKAHKVATREEAEKLAADPENFETPAQLMDFINKQNRMNQQLDKDFEKWEKDKQTFTEQLEVETQRRETIEGYVSEFGYLVSKGLLPAPDAKYLEADWNDPEVAKQPGVKEQLQLMNYMVKENKVRAKAGIKPLTSIVDTYNAMQSDPEQKPVDDTAKAEAAAKKAQEEQRKAAGARVAGVSPAQQGPLVPKGIAVGNPNVLRRGASQWDD